MMIICFVDIERSTERLFQQGHDVTVALRRQLDDVVGQDADELRPEIVGRMFSGLPNESAPNPPLRYRGGRQGDGLMIGAPRQHAVAMLRTAMALQEEGPWQHPKWVGLMYMALGIANVNWDNGPYGKHSAPNGLDINTLARLLKVEVAGCIVVNRQLIEEVREYANDLLPMIEIKAAELPGIAGLVTYGRIPAKPLPKYAPIITGWRRFSESHAAIVVTTAGIIAWGFLALWWWR